MLCRQEVARRQCGTHLGTSGYLQATHECLHACTSIIREHLATFTSGLAVPPWSEKSDQVSTYTGGRSLQGRVRPPSRRRLRCGSAAENTGSQPANQQLLPNNHGKLLAAARHGQRGRTQAAGPGKEGRTGATARARANRGSVPRTRVATGPADGFIPRRRAPAGSAASAGMACIGVSFVGDRAPAFRPVAPPTPLRRYLSISTRRASVGCCGPPARGGVGNWMSWGSGPVRTIGAGGGAAGSRGAITSRTLSAEMHAARPFPVAGAYRVQCERIGSLVQAAIPYGLGNNELTLHTAS